MHLCILARDLYCRMTSSRVTVSFARTRPRLIWLACALLLTLSRIVPDDGAAPTTVYRYRTSCCSAFPYPRPRRSLLGGGSRLCCSDCEDQYFDDDVGILHCFEWVAMQCAVFGIRYITRI